MRTPGPGPQCLDGIGPLDLFERDPRPTLVIDTRGSAERGSFLPSYWNPAFTEYDTENILKSLQGTGPVCDESMVASAPKGFQGFKKWILDIDNSAAASFTFCNHTWIKIPVSSKWAIISRLLPNPDPATSRPTYTKPVGSMLKSSARSKTATFDWTYDAEPDRMTDHIKWARNIDWAST